MRLETAYVEPQDSSGCGTGGGGQGGGIAKGTDCSNALAQDTTTDGTDKHNSQIESRYAIWDDNSSSNAIVAFEYHTYGGQDYYEFQGGFSGGISLGPVSGSLGSPGHILYPSQGGVWQTFQWLLGVSKTAQSSLPWPLNKLAANDTIEKNACHTSG
jgi:hypothetical protein